MLVPWWSLTFLVISVIVLGWLALIYSSTDSSGFWGESILPNLATEIVGILITILLVDTLLHRRENAENRVRAKSAFRKMREETNILIVQLANVIFGTLDKAPRKRVESLNELFDENLTTGLSALNPNAADTGNELASRWENFTDVAERVVDTYGLYLDTAYIQALEDLTTSTFLLEVKQLCDHPDPTIPAYVQMGSPAMVKSRQVFFARLLDFLECHNRLCGGEYRIIRPRIPQRSRIYPGPLRKHV